MRKTILTTGLFVAALGTGASLGGVAFADNATPAKSQPSTIEYVLNGDPQTTMTETHTGPNTKVYRIPVGGHTYVLNCANETPEVWYCGVKTK